jgi:hypothetical protein
MSLSHELVQDDRQLVRYLLGLLAEEETERLDEASIADEEVASRLCTVENDLVDAYVRGTLDGETLERFNSFYLASPRRRHKVRFAERFLGAVDRAPRPAPRASAASTGLNVIRRMSIAPRSKSIWRVAAAALLVVACGVLVLEDVRLRRGLREAGRESEALHERAQSLTRQLDQQRAAHAEIVREGDRIRAALPTRTTALVLLPQTRAMGPVSTIAVLPGTDVVAIDLRLEPGDFSGYQVALKDPATNDVVWRSDPLTPTASRRPPTISVAVPADVLKPQHYSFELTGRRAAATEVVGSYTLRIERT